jgi:hypothetical protein
MTRVGRCADLIAERLAANEWVALTGRLHWPPSERDQQIINDIEQFTAALLPPSLVRSGTSSGTTTKRSRRPASAWVAPCSRWTPACLSSSAHDLPAQGMERASVRGRSGSRRSLESRPRAGLSGQGQFQRRRPYSIEPPCLGTDPVFINGRHRLPFVGYLRLAVRWGGFPRLKRHADKTEVRDFVAENGEGYGAFLIAGAEQRGAPLERGVKSPTPRDPWRRPVAVIHWPLALCPALGASSFSLSSASGIIRPNIELNIAVGIRPALPPSCPCPPDIRNCGTSG